MNVCFASCMGIQESLGFWIPRPWISDSRFCNPVLVSGSCVLDFNRLVGFRITLAVFRIPLKPLKIPASASTIFLNFRFRILLPRAKSCTCRGFLCHPACRRRVSESKQASNFTTRKRNTYYMHTTYILAKAIRGRQCGDAVY